MARCFVISSPSGGGKTSLIKRLLLSNPSLFLSVSLTSRAPRPAEIDGVDYVFVSRGQFEEKLVSGQFIQYAEIFGNLYGDLLAPIESALAAGKDVIFDIDFHGYSQLKQKIHPLTSIFILPPSREVLVQRLAARGMPPDQIKNRLADFKNELKLAQYYDFTIINSDFEMALSEIQTIIARCDGQSSLISEAQ